MDLKQYETLSILTNKWRGDNAYLKQLQEAKATITFIEAPKVYCAADLEHWCIGMASEFNELFDALIHLDVIGVEEELADIMWYATKFATVLEIPMVAQTDLGVYYYDNLVHAVSRFIDDIKKLNIYNRPMKADGDDEKVINQKNFEERLQKIISICYNFTASNGVYGAKVNLPQALDRNIDKLMRKRYPNGYSDVAANNRNLIAERAALEGKD